MTVRARFFPVLLLLGSGQTAHAAPEEVQVYMDEINPAGTAGLDVHLNYVTSGQPGADYAGAEPSLHDFRVTPEFSLGLGSGFEAGLYLPLATLSSDGVFRAQGVKARIKWIAPHAQDSAFYWGANFELGRVAYRLDQNPWNAELKGIAGWRRAISRVTSKAAMRPSTRTSANGISTRVLAAAMAATPTT